MEKGIDQLHSGNDRGRGRGRGQARAARARSTSSRGRAHRSLDFSEILPAQPSAASPAAPGPSGSGVCSQSSEAQLLTLPPMKRELKKVRDARVGDRKRLKQIDPTKKEKVLAKREESELASYLVPGAPERKQKSKVPSPPRRPCLLRPNVPATPPAQKMKYWEAKSSESPACSSKLPDTSRPFRYEGSPEPETSTPPQKWRKTLAAAASCTPTATLYDEADIPVYQDEEVVNFSPSSYVADEAMLLGVASSTTHQELESLQPESHIYEDVESERTIGECPETSEIHPGSDVDEDDEDVGITIGRSVDLFGRSLIDGCDPELVLEQLDRQEDIAIRDLAAEDMLRFQWSNDPNVFKGQREQFTGPAGPTFSTEGLSPLEIFTKIWDDSIINLIVQETNRYAFQNNAKGWTDVTSAEIWAFFAVMMLQSIAPLPVEKHYWYASLSQLQMPNFKDVMKYPRFLAIKKNLHFVDNTALPLAQMTGDNTKLQKILPILNHLNSKFCSLYLPEQNIAIDESLLLWKGRLSFVQLIATKAARVGIKSYELCESRTGYLWQMMVYTGKGEVHTKSQENEPEGATSKIVYGLVRPLLNKGHTLVMDNFYNSPLLSRMLKHQKTDTMGTLRLNREFVPDSLRGKSKTNTRAGEILATQTHDLSIVAWHDANMVSMISSYHKPEIGGIEKYGRYKYKPQVVLDYNLSMGGVDKKDQMLQAFPVERIRNLIWYKKLFRRLFNISIHNSFVMYNVGKNKSQRFFREALTAEIIKNMKLPNPRMEVHPKEDHYITKNTSGRARCQWCSKKKVLTRTAYKCGVCGKNLCVVGCFRDYHKSLE